MHVISRIFLICDIHHEVIYFNRYFDKFHELPANGLLTEADVHYEHAHHAGYEKHHSYSIHTLKKIGRDCYDNDIFYQNVKTNRN